MPIKILEKNYPKSLINCEKVFYINKISKRYDIVVYDSLGDVKILVECKSYDVNLTKEHFDQVMRYNLELKSKYVIVTNGLRHFYFEFDEDEKILEAIIFSSTEPLSINYLKKSCPFIEDIGASLKRLMDFYSNRAVNLVKINNTYAFRTSSYYSSHITQKVEKKVKSGDHTIIICLITNCIKLNTKKPLIYYKSKYHTV